MIHELSEKMHALAVGAFLVGAFTVSSALAEPSLHLESRTFPGNCIGGFHCGGFQSYFRGTFPQPQILREVQFLVSSTPMNPYSRIYVDIYSNGQRVAQGVDVTGWNQYRSVALPGILAWDLVIVPVTFDSIQLGNVTVLYEAQGQGPGNGNPGNGNPGTPGNGNPSYPGQAQTEVIHCSSVQGQTAQCVPSFAQVTNVQISSSGTNNSFTPCQYGFNWGLNGNTLWVSNGCSGDFIVSGTY